MDFFEAMQILKDGGKVEHSLGMSKLILSLEPVRQGQPKVLMATAYQGKITRFRKPLVPMDYLMKSWSVIEDKSVKKVEEKKVEEVKNVVVKKPRAKKSSRKQEKVEAIE